MEPRRPPPSLVKLTHRRANVRASPLAPKEPHEPQPVPAQIRRTLPGRGQFRQAPAAGAAFGEYDQNLVALENRLGVYIPARGQRVLIEGAAEAVAHARDVLQDLYTRVIRGEDVDTGLVDA